MNTKRVRKVINLLVGCALVACSLVSAHVFAQESIKILPLGDSITHGGNESPSYRRALWFKLKEQGYDVDFVGSQRTFHGRQPPNKRLDFDLDHEGHWGWETNQIVEALPVWLNTYTADIALVHLGTNDFDRGESPQVTMEELSTVVSLLRQKNPTISILMAQLIPMRGKNTTEFNAALSEWAGAQSTELSKLILVDMHSGYYPRIFNYDKYHPNFIGEKRLANRWFDAMKPFLER